MPRQWKSPELRFWALQGALCLVLAATLALAAVVRSHKAHANRVELDPLKAYGLLQLRKPADWTPTVSVDGVTLTEPPAAERPGRKLRVWHAPNDVFLSPLEYLVRAGDLSARDAAMLLGAGVQDDQSASLRTISIAGWPGVLVSQTRWITAAGVRRPITWKQTLACTVLPSGDALLLKLEGQGVADEHDEKIVRRVADSIIVSNRLRPTRGGKLELGRGIELVAPDSLAGLPAASPFRAGRTLAAPEGAAWLAVDLTPCLLAPGEPPETLASKMKVRDPEIRTGPVRQLDPRTWLCEREGEAAALFPTVAYLRRYDDGRALLAEFRWNAGPGGKRGAVGAAWEALAGQLRFLGGEPAPQQLVQQAIDARRLLPPRPVTLLEAWPHRETWQWYHESSPRTSAAVFTWETGALGINGSLTLESSPPLSGFGGESIHWWLSEDWAYRTHRQRTSATGIVVQESRSDAGALVTTLEDGRGRRLADTSRTLPDAFFPGALLPLIMGRLPYQPLALQTEMLLDPTGWTSSDPVTLLLEPAFDMPRYPAGSNEAMRCWKLEVSGSGRSSRWYLGADGRLQVISFGGGLHLHRIEAESATRPAMTQPATLPADAE